MTHTPTTIQPNVQLLNQPHIYDFIGWLRIIGHADTVVQVDGLDTRDGSFCMIHCYCASKAPHHAFYATYRAPGSRVDVWQRQDTSDSLKECMSSTYSTPMEVVDAFAKGIASK
jgi:hypothetical protein